MPNNDVIYTSAVLYREPLWRVSNKLMKHKLYFKTNKLLNYSELWELGPKIKLFSTGECHNILYNRQKLTLKGFLNFP